MEIIDYIIVTCSILIVISFSCAGAIALYNATIPPWFIDFLLTSVLLFIFFIGAWALHIDWKMGGENKKKREEK